MAEHAKVVDQLIMLGFSQYEARTYVGLVGQPAMTGYALSNATQVPQPKVYETLRRLEEKQAVVRIGQDPARYVAIAPDVLLDQLESRFQSRLTDAKDGLRQVAETGPAGGVHVFEGAKQWEAVAATATSAVQHATRHICVSAHAEQLADLRTALCEADTRGVRIDALCIGKTTLDFEHGSLLTHSSTDGVIHRHHRARHLALVVDNATALWALAPAGDDWDSISGGDPMLLSVVEGYIRHDIYVQRIYRDFRSELDESYGPGLEALISHYGTRGQRAPAAKPARRPRRRPA
ncbi:MAG TPA: helix-turn-helix domain-containing protein [Pseudonocardiaceae bacterium]|nr:helix-turn-helix domain-containing protein [Pseudonocardiaceae bacterium]